MNLVLLRCACRRRAFTVVELLVVAALLGVIAALCMPLLGKGREASLEAGCVQNLRQLYVALQLFVQDNNQRFPPNRANDAYVDARNPAGVHHQQFFTSYLPNFVFPPANAQQAGPFWCPADTARRDHNEALSMHSYGVNILHGLNDADRFHAVADPHLSIYLVDATRSSFSTCRLNHKAWPFTLGATGTQAPLASNEPRVDLRHRDKANALFLDGHVSSFPIQPFVGKSPSRMTW